MAQDLTFSPSSISTRLGSGLIGASIALAGCGGGFSEPPKALSDAQRAVCKDESIQTAKDILAGKNTQSGKGFLNKIYTPQGTPTDQDIYLQIQQREQAKCEQETRSGQRKHSEDRGTVYPAFGTNAQADTAPVPAPAASAPADIRDATSAPAPAAAASAPVPVVKIPADQSIDPAKERIEPPASAASAPEAAASAPETAASATAAKEENWARKLGKRAIGSAGGPEAGASSPTR